MAEDNKPANPEEDRDNDGKTSNPKPVTPVTPDKPGDRR